MLKEAFTLDKIKSWCLMIIPKPSRARDCVTPEGIRFSVEEARQDNNAKENKPQNQRGWVREEMVVLVAEYFRTRGLSSQERKQSIQMISKVLRNRAIANGETISDTFRNINGIQMQTACIMKYDPQVMREKETAGLSGGSKLMVQIIKEYLICPEKINSEAYMVLAKNIARV